MTTITDIRNRVLARKEAEAHKEKVEQQHIESQTEILLDDIGEIARKFHKLSMIGSSIAASLEPVARFDTENQELTIPALQAINDILDAVDDYFGELLDLADELVSDEEALEVAKEVALAA